jgi:hypothetical protein
MAVTKRETAATAILDELFIGSFLSVSSDVRTLLAGYRRSDHVGN